MKKIAILGATGYTGHELLKILKNHPEVEIIALNSRSFAGQPVKSLYTDYKGDDTYTDYSIEQINEMKPDLIFTALPHKVSMETVKQIDQSIRVVDLSADYRFADHKTYEQVYDRDHVDPETHAVYGLPELFADDIKQARLVANPGCYATGGILAVYPIQDRASHIIMDCKEGWSGAGRESPYAKDPSIIKDNLIAYKLAHHRHKYEMEQFIKTPLGFTPRVIDTFQGMMCTAHIILKESAQPDEIIEVYRKFYENAPFVKIDPAAVQIRETQKNNYCIIGGFEIDEANRLVIVSTLDNLIKGASGQAVQNMNLMLGLNQGAGLLQI
jgi:N-acetyl-gamma-glutamyl-phosphate reductase